MRIFAQSAKVYDMTGELDINGLDAWTTYGVGLEKGALATLMTPPPMKEAVSNSSRLEDGVRYLSASAAKVDKRDITLQFHLKAASQSDYITKYGLLMAVLKTGRVILHEKKYTNAYYRCYYVSCSSYQHNINGLSKFTLKLTEPDPTDRGATSTHAGTWS